MRKALTPSRRRSAASNPSSRQTVENRIVDIAGDLARSLNGVLKAIPGAPHRPQRLARSLGVNTILTSRILKATAQSDPLAVAHIMPGPEPLRRLLRAAAAKKVDAALIAQARAAVDRFEQLIDAEAGDRSSLDAIISGWLPDARQKVELIAKQSVFRGISQLLGCACDTTHTAVVVYPGSERHARADVVSITITDGLRRVRPGHVVKYDTVHATTPMLTITGEPVESLHGLLLEEFCSRPVPRLRVNRSRDCVQYTLIGDGVGVKSAVNLVHATLLPGKKDLFLGPGEPPRKVTMATGIAMPSRTLLFDVLVHEDVYPRQEPTLQLYRTVGVVARGESTGAEREVDRLDVVESVQALGRGIDRFRAAESPRYQNIIRFVCAQRGWDGNLLRGFRCRIEFPLYSSEIVMAFDLPAKP